MSETFTPTPAGYFDSKPILPSEDGAGNPVQPPPPRYQPSGRGAPEEHHYEAVEGDGDDGLGTDDQIRGRILNELEFDFGIDAEFRASKAVADKGLSWLSGGDADLKRLLDLELIEGRQIKVSELPSVQRALYRIGRLLGHGTSTGKTGKGGHMGEQSEYEEVRKERRKVPVGSLEWKELTQRMDAIAERMEDGEPDASRSNMGSMWNDGGTRRARR